MAVEALMVTFNNRNLSARVRLAAAEALIRLQSPTADIALLAALRSERWSVRRSAAAVLGQMDADWAVEPLIKALQDPYEVVRRTARAALEHIGTPEAIHAIEAVGDLAIEPPSMGEITSASKPAPTPERTSPATSEVTSLSTGVESAGHAITSTLPSGIEADLSPGPAQKTVAPGENNPSPPLQQKPASSDFSLNLASVSSATITGESSVHSSVGTISEEKVANTEPAHDLNTVTRAVPGNAAQSEIASTVPIVIESPSAADSQSHDTEEDTRPMTPIPDDVS
ncbi:MAG: HEAT repeat domain-containing protein [Anaerolineae bacterium]